LVEVAIVPIIGVTQEGEMAAYLIAEHKITDAVKFKEYAAKVGPMIEKHGGRYLTKTGSHNMPEDGHWKPERVVIIEFPDMDEWKLEFESHALTKRARW
jgi:uncharacterized protein (DUF1330 family)